MVEGLGAAVTDQELEREIAYLLSKQASLGIPNLKTMERISGELLTNKLLLKEAMELGLEKDPKVQYEIQRAKQRALINARLALLSAEDLTDSQKSILAKEYWHAHQDEFKTKNKRGLSHILIGLRGRSEEEAAAGADKVYKQLLEAPDKFEAMAEELSDDPGSKIRKGSLGLVESDRLVPEFSKVAFALKAVGDISEPVKTRFGYHVIRLDEIVDAKLSSFEEVKDLAKEKALEAYVKNRQQQHLNALQASSNRKINTDEIRRVWEKMFKPPE
ncbi:MAG: peptidylprolyl isomerase [Candidatus Thiodiazotropha sp. (ex Codakia orbicularis)]|nr:peptidylprolyl isomerase [Candidatus Thiodiazotropha sp. (ex Codakia orbicularis)]